ncbi:uncharacterized protein isoform X3 [Musca autumnalis]|uniref:uncharacterized protein isoform X3 n=1 Tax=Musca autumnalis TaxID=221902 RepID=UPI003CEFC5DB
MPPPRPRSIAAPNPNTPMSERQQMALLIQMTASSDISRSTQKSKDHKKDEDFEESNFSEKTDNKDKIEETNLDNKKEGCFDIVNSTEASSSNIMKRTFSDIDEDECDDSDDIKKKKRKEADVTKDAKQSGSQRFPNRVEKAFKQNNNSKTNSTINKSGNASDKDDIIKGKPLDSEIDDDDSKSDPLCNGGLKVPPLKIVIPQQNCTIDSDCGGTRAGKLNTARNPALPYVVASNNDSNDRDISTTNTSPRDSPIKLNHSCGTAEEKNSKLNEEKNLRVLRSAHRVGLSANDRNSNNSSPQIPSNSPSPASSTANDLVESKVPYSNNNGSPPHQNISFDHDNILNLPSPSTSSTSSSKEVLANNVELHPRKRKIRAKTEEVKANTGNNDIVVCSDSHPHDLPFTNCFQMYMNIRRQIEKKWKNVFLVKPRPPQGFNEYLLNTKNYMLQSKKSFQNPDLPNNISNQMKEIYMIQQKDRLELYHRHAVEREKLCLNVEQEILRIHTKAARNMACQLLPFSACSYMKDDEVYNIVTHEQEDKEKNARYRYNGRLLLSWLQDVDDKWEKIKRNYSLQFPPTLILSF